MCIPIHVHERDNISRLLNRIIDIKTLSLEKEKLLFRVRKRGRRKGEK